jgi:uncharacterized protein YaiI (UPF0178 family)
MNVPEIKRFQIWIDANACPARGELFDENSVRDRLDSRNLMEQFRSQGIDRRRQENPPRAGVKPMQAAKELTNGLARA